MSSKGGNGVVNVAVELTERGFKQDADQAMKGDLLLGLVEAVTNADDAYGDRDGGILIRVSKGRVDGWAIIVRDRACGIPFAEVRRKILKLGSRTSGFEIGRSTRGNRGRGAKDLAAFGSVRFDTICGDEYSWLKLERSGKGQMTEKPRRATRIDREALGITRGAGMQVTIGCRVAPPRAITLRQKLERSVALRLIMTDPRRRVMFEYGDAQSVHLHYQEPAGLREVERAELNVPGYPEKASITIKEAPQAFDDAPSSPTREGGLLIISGRAVHEATLFSFENDPYAQFLYGEVRWEAIDRIQREFDERDELGEPPTPGNPFSIISRSRVGLEKTHPAYKALRDAVERVLKKYVDRKRREAGETGRESAETRRRLEALAQIIAKFSSDKEEELELEREIGPGVGTQPEFRIIPPAKQLEQGRTHTFTVELLREKYDEAPGSNVTLDVETDPAGLILLSSREVTLKPAPPRATGPARPAVMRGTFSVTATNLLGDAIIAASFPSVRSCDTQIKVIPPITIEPPEPPLTFQFERSRYNVLPGKSKSILLLAPDVAVDRHGTKVTVTSSNPDGVLVRQRFVELKPSVDGPWHQAVITVEGRQLGADSTIEAICGVLPASTQVVVRREQTGPAFSIDIREIPGPQRSTREKKPDGTIVIVINAGHPAARRYFGPAANDFPNQESLAAKLLIAEIIAEDAVRDILSRKYGAQPIDVVSYYAEQLRLMNELLPRCHASQVSQAELEAPMPAAIEGIGKRKARPGLKETMRSPFFSHRGSEIKLPLPRR